MPHRTAVCSGCKRSSKCEQDERVPVCDSAETRLKVSSPMATEQEHVTVSMLWTQVGMGVDSSFMPPHDTDFTVVVSGSVCTPCQTLMPALQPVPSDSLQPGITKAMTGPVRLDVTLRLMSHDHCQKPWPQITQHFCLQATSFIAISQTSSMLLSAR